MKRCKDEILDELVQRYPNLGCVRKQVHDAYSTLHDAFLDGNKLLIAGNGGSASDSDHISGELLKSFTFNRRVSPSMEGRLCEMFGDEGRSLSCTLEGGLPAIALPSLCAPNSAFANDKDPTASFAQMVNSLGSEGDVFLGISTSGNSANIVKAMMVARAKDMRTILLTGESGGRCRALSDISICVPERETYKVQELHLPIYHAICAMLECSIFDER